MMKFDRGQSTIAVGRTSTMTAVATSVSHERAAMGGKTIGFWGGVALLINNITGGSMVLFPQLYQQGGWMLVTLALIIIMTLSAACGLMFIESMALMRGNNRFQKRVEYTTVAEYYLPRNGYYVVQLFFQLCITCNNMSMIIQSVQVMDFTIVAIAGRSCALPQIVPHFGFSCPDPVVGDITPFGSTMYLVPLGWFVTAALVFPLSLCNLDDNVKVQKGAFFSVIIILLIWIGIFISRGLDASYVPAVGGSMTNIMGTVIFNYALISSLPSWVNEKKKDVSIVWSLCIAMPMATSMFICLGFFGGLAFPPWTDSETILDKVLTLNMQIANITFYIFPVVVNLTSIPVFSIMQRYNLVEQKICSPLVANFLAVVLPWIVVIPLYTGSGYQNLVNYAGIILNSSVNFVFPPIIYLIAIRRRAKEEAEYTTVPTEKTLEMTVTKDAARDSEVTHPLQPLIDQDALTVPSASTQPPPLSLSLPLVLPLEPLPLTNSPTSPVRRKPPTIYSEAPPLSALTDRREDAAASAGTLSYQKRAALAIAATGDYARRLLALTIPRITKTSTASTLWLAAAMCLLWMALLSYWIVWMSNVIARGLGVDAILMGFFVVSIVVSAPIAAVRSKFALSGYSWALDGSGDVVMMTLGFGIACLAYSAFVSPLTAVPIPIGEELLIVLFTLFIIVSATIICLMSLRWRLTALVIVAAAVAAVVMIVEIFVLDFVPLLSVSTSLTEKDICSQ